jgi:hypothetical protein
MLEDEMTYQLLHFALGWPVQCCVQCWKGMQCCGKKDRVSMHAGAAGLSAGGSVAAIAACGGGVVVARLLQQQLLLLLLL